MRRNVATVKHRWIKNPFNSMYFAVQAMAAEQQDFSDVSNSKKW
jgi:hypothetical protein